MAQSELWYGRPSCSPSSSSSSGFFFLPSGRFFPPLGGSLSLSDGFLLLLPLDFSSFLSPSSFFLPSDHFFSLWTADCRLLLHFLLLPGWPLFLLRRCPRTVLLRRPLVGFGVILPRRLLLLLLRRPIATVGGGGAPIVLLRRSVVVVVVVAVLVVTVSGGEGALLVVLGGQIRTFDRRLS